MTTPKTFGVLGPVIHPDRYAVDPRVAVTEYEFTVYMCRLAKERPDFAERLFDLIMDGQPPTMH
jgi:hypothetical protein